VVAADGELFLVMEYVQGESLARLLRASRKRDELPPVRIVAAILANVLHGLHAAHEATNERGAPLHMVHRDVSPQNVLVGADGVARLVDFGIAKAAGRLQTTRGGQVKGKLAYMAPEQITGTATRKTDVYAASVCLWEALTGRRLFEGENEGAVLHQALYSRVSPPSEHVPGLDAAWDPIVLRGLARDGARRYGTAREMAIDIETYLPIAHAREVGEWVESLAREALAKRAAAMIAIESISNVDRVLDSRSSLASASKLASSSAVSRQRAAHEPTAPLDVAAREPTSSRVLAVSWPLDGAARASRRSRKAIAAIGAGAVVAIAAAGFIAARPTRKAAPKPSASTIPASPAPAEGPVPGLPPTRISAPPDSPASPTTLSVPTTAPPLASAPPAVSQSLPAVYKSMLTSRAPGAKANPSARSPKEATLDSILDTRH
ncbi:MAG TPA: protein kinase, partial [Polyangiaceae bacterium]